MRSLMLGFALAMAMGSAAVLKAQAEEIDTTKLRPGLLLDFFPVTDVSKPDKPAGRSIATLIYREGFPVSYHKPMELEPALQQFRDRFWLIRLSGYVELVEDGDYTFAHSLSLTRGWAHCGGDIALENKVIVTQGGGEFSQFKNAFTDIRLGSGLYEIAATFYCTKRGSENSIPDFDLGIRGPRDPMLHSVDPGRLYHLGG